VAPSCAVLIAPTNLLSAFSQRAALPDGEVLSFADTDVLRALEAITARKPRLVALERLFAATPRGVALINRIKADPSLMQTELRVLSHDSDYSRLLPRIPAGAMPSARTSEPEIAEPIERAQPPAGAPSVGVVEPPPAAAIREPEPETADRAPAGRALLDPTGTRRAPRYAMAHKIEIMIDGNPATLLDLSTCGAQVISPTILRPNQRVRMALNDEKGVLRFNAAIAWAAFEIPPQIGPQYRAGIDFVDADPTAIDAFCVRHRA
jgi:PilZ domain-containing protein